MFLLDRNSPPTSLRLSDLAMLLFRYGETARKKQASLYGARA